MSEGRKIYPVIQADRDMAGSLAAMLIGPARAGPYDRPEDNAKRYSQPDAVFKLYCDGHRDHDDITQHMAQHRIQQCGVQS